MLATGALATTTVPVSPGSSTDFSVVLPVELVVSAVEFHTDASAVKSATPLGPLRGLAAQAERTDQVVVLIEQAAPGGTWCDVAELVHRLPEVGDVSGTEHTTRLHSTRLPVPLCALLVVAFRVMDGVAALHGTAGGVEAG